MSKLDVMQFVRPNVQQLQPYSSARDEFEGKADIYLDANENPYLNGYNRYPDPHQKELKAALAAELTIKESQIFLGNGSDEAIDLLFRVFCQPGQDRCVICPPTYGMYKVSAGVNDIGIISVPLTPDFQPDLAALEPYFHDPTAKLLFLCSPNNPTGNLMQKEIIWSILEQFQGIVVVDEAYIDFAPEGSVLDQLAIGAEGEYPNLVVLRTFSKARGLAGLRLGMAFANPSIIDLMNRIKPPYNVNALTQEIALQELVSGKWREKKDEIIGERKRLAGQLAAMPGVQKVFPSDANFILVRFTEPARVFAELREKSTIVRDRTGQVDGCLRITVGTPTENDRLIEQLSDICNPES